MAHVLSTELSTTNRQEAQLTTERASLNRMLQMENGNMLSSLQYWWKSSQQPLLASEIPTSPSSAIPASTACCQTYETA